MICVNSKEMLHLNESSLQTGKYVLEGVFAELDTLNRNRRIYPKEEYLKHLQYLREDIKNEHAILGELDHPEDRFEVKLKEASHKVTNLWYDEASNCVMGQIELLDTPNGKLAKTLLDEGVPLHISSRAAGTVDPNTNRVSIQQIYTYDLVCKPGFAGAVLHRINESEGDAYTDDVRKFLTESENKETKNEANTFEMLNEDVSVTEVDSAVVLRKEASLIAEEDNEESKEKEENEEGAEDSEETSDEKDEKETEDDGVEILDVKPVIKGGDDEESEDDVDIKDVKASDEEDEDKEEDDEDKADEDGDKTDECDSSESEDKDKDCGCSGSDCEKKNALFDCKDIKDKREKFEDKFAELVDRVNRKAEKAKKNESQTIDNYPISAMLDKSNFSSFVKLDESQKRNVVAYLKDYGYCTPVDINENWKAGVDYNACSENWLRFAPESYRQLYESASPSVKESIKETASFVLFENQNDINNFWENTGLVGASRAKMLNENFKNNLINISESEKQETGLPYSKAFIDSVADMASDYNN